MGFDSSGISQENTQSRINNDFLFNHYPVHKQKQFGSSIAKKFGYDFNRGRLDSTVHPFEISFTREDVRITTRFYENFLNPSLFGTLHEAGHGIYEQNIDPNFKEPLSLI